MCEQSCNNEQKSKGKLKEHQVSQALPGGQGAPGARGSEETGLMWLPVVLLNAAVCLPARLPPPSSRQTLSALSGSTATPEQLDEPIKAAPPPPPVCGDVLSRSTEHGYSFIQIFTWS